MSKNVLFISGAFGLGHIMRDLAIARALRRQDPALKIHWLASGPAGRIVEDAGEVLLPESEQFADLNVHAERTAKGAEFSLVSYMKNIRKHTPRNVEIFKKVVNERHFHIVVADTAFEISLARADDPHLKYIPYVEMFRFIGFNSMKHNPFEKIKVYLWNSIWARDYKRSEDPRYLSLFIGEPDDVPDIRFGMFLPRLRDYAERKCSFTGYVIDFDPKDYADQSKMKEKLGYGKKPLLLCAIGGTTIGKKLLDLCGRAYAIIKKHITDLNMVMVCGPRLSTQDIQAPAGVDIRGYVPKLYEHFAASDMTIVQGGGNSTLELTALKQPFIYFPLEKHFEQQIHVTKRLKRHRAGIRMSYKTTTPESLAKAVISNFGMEVDYAKISTDGAQKAAHYILQLLKLLQT
jgi:predicted glycosyltransferase